MQYVAPDRWKWALLGYASGGGAAALLVEPLSQAFARAGANPVLGVLVVANLIYPALIVAVAVWHPRARLVPLGALLSLLAFTAVRMAWRDLRIWNWSPELIVQTIHPVIVVGSVIAGGLAAAMCLAMRPIRRVGIADAPWRCGNCGYLVRSSGGLIAGADRCPECGAAIEAA